MRASIANDLASRLPATRAALLGGAIGWYQAMVVSESLMHLPGEAATAVEARVVGDAERLSANRLRP